VSAGARRVAWVALVAALLALRAAQALHESVNWDEFALLDRVAQSLRTGELRAGGKPGLAVLALVPFVSGCQDEIAVARAARLAWIGVTTALLAGLFALLRELLRGERSGAADAALGVALLACVPAFVRWSLQVRTDQLALALALWGGFALLRSRRRLALAALAGVLFGLGYLATQKALYAAGLAGVLAAGDAWRRGAWRAPHEAARAGLALAGALVSVGAFELALALSQTARPPATLAGAFDAFAFYRRTLGFAHYRAMLPSLLPHAALAVGLALAAARAPADGRVRLAGAALAMGVGVAVFHAAAFFYFWMTLGLFAAAAGALAVEPVRALFGARERAARAALAGLWLALAGQAALASLECLRDTQAIQRATLAFVRRNFSAGEAGFQPERALFCRADAEPLPLYFSQHIHARFGGPRGAENAARLIDEFRARPVKFLVESWRLGQFPPEVQRFWLENYPHYYGAARVAGRRVAGAAGVEQRVDLVAAGRYRWLPLGAAVPAEIDGVERAPGEVFELDAGPHLIVLRGELTDGLLVLAMRDRYAPVRLPFYRGFL
jgi:hypothetical protein